MRLWEVNKGLKFLYINIYELGALCVSAVPKPKQMKLGGYHRLLDITELLVTNNVIIGQLFSKGRVSCWDAQC